MHNISSEQELKQLLDEGRITEEEYKELLEALRQKETVQKPVEKPKESKPRTGYGKAALIMMIAGILLPIIGIVVSLFFDYIGIRFEMFLIPIFLIGMLCGLLAFIFGIISWKTTQGKIAAICVLCLGVLFVLGVLVSVAGYSSLHPNKKQLPPRDIISLKTYPLGSMDGVITHKGIEFDPHISTDGNGSLKITTDSLDKTVIRLFETGPINVENHMLFYFAQLKSNSLSGKAYLEMWCDIPGKGEFFSRGLDRAIMGQTDWAIVQTPFRLEPGQKPANVKLNLIIEGTGTVWIDDIKLLSSPLD